MNGDVHADHASRGPATGASRFLTGLAASGLPDESGGTDVHIRHDGIPDKVPAADNETGTRMSLANLARLVEAA